MNNQQSTTQKFIVLKVADYLLALPIVDVLKVVNCPASAYREFKNMGLVQLGRHTIRVLDLQGQFSSGDVSQVSTNPDFLIITRSLEGELWGIGVQETPNLMDLPLENRQSLPKFESQSGFLELVSHSAVVSNSEVTNTIFLLDIKRLLDVINNSHRQSLSNK
ncbi:MAG: chemotaxis protein CheW [Symploca sp. SIO1C4]|uniref:Chemotaxis protein CheW n=1 Tax=Symploca sp. SIO1C4 TaxID=2607765 RepID=A0A6B3NAT7_9CYAN|nr:chemotaxis protein CheW [Symploca sp. SIO1C4]